MSDAQTFYALMNQTLPFLGASFGIGLFFAAIYYMYAKILNDKIVESRAKAAVFTVFETIAIFAFIYVGNMLFETLVYSLVGLPAGGSASSMAMPHLKLANIAMDSYYDKSLSLYMSMIISEFVIQTIVQMTSVQIPLTLTAGGVSSVALGSVGISVSTDEMFGLINNLYNTLIRTCIDMMLVTILRKSILDLALPAMALMFPMGLFLRGLYITKRTGSSLIALSIVLYFIYPLSVAFGSYVAGFVPAVTFADLSLNPMDPASYMAAYSGGNLARAYSPTVSDASGAMTYANSYSVPTPEEAANFGRGEEKATVSIGDLESKELYLAPGKYLGVLVAKSIAYSSSAGAINFALGFLPPEMAAVSMAGRFLVNLIAGLLMLTSISWFALITFAFNGVMVQGTIMMNQLGLLIITTVIDLIICVTMYRVLADVFAGDRSILGLSKVL
jgi:hypothetical protein